MEKIAAQDSKINSLIRATTISSRHKLTRFKAKYLLFKKQTRRALKQKWKLSAWICKTFAEIDELFRNIVARNESLANQARSTQTNGTATSYINTKLEILASITEAISRVAAMSEIVSANNKMLEQQKKDKEVIAEKQVANNEAINTAIKQPREVSWWWASFGNKTSWIESSSGKSCGWKSDCWKRKEFSLEEKAAAEKAAEAAAREAAYKAEQESKRQASWSFRKYLPCKLRFKQLLIQLQQQKQRLQQHLQ